MGVVGRLDQYASMLAYEFDDYSMSENLLKYSNDFNQGVWGGYCGSKSNITYNTTDVVSPDGRNNSTKVARGSNGCDGSLSWGLLWNSPTGGIIIDTTNIFTASIYARGAVGGEVINIGFNDSQMTNHTLTTSWQRISRTGIANTTDRGFQVKSDTINQTFYILEAQLETGSVATDYTPTSGTAISRVLPATTNTNITGLGTYYSSGFYENVGFTTFLSANVFAPYDLVYDEFSGTLFGAGQGRYMRQNTDKSVIVYNEIDEVSDFRDIVRSGLVLDLDAGMNASYNGTGEIWTDLSGNSNNATRTNNGGYGGQVTYSSSGFFDFSMNSPASQTSAFGGNGFTMSSVIVPTTGSFTLSAFVRRNLIIKAAGDRETIFSNAGSGDGWRFGITSTGGIYYLIGGVGSSGYQESDLGGSILNNSNWHMMSVVFDRAAQLGTYSIYGYIDGIASGNNAISAGAGGNVAFTATAPGVGYGGCCDVFAGQIATVSAYNRALSAAEVQQNYNALRNRFQL